jgi:hypothetical protein
MKKRTTVKNIRRTNTDNNVVPLNYICLVKWNTKYNTKLVRLNADMP